MRLIHSHKLSKQLTRGIYRISNRMQSGRRQSAPKQTGSVGIVAVPFFPRQFNSPHDRLNQFGIKLTRKTIKSRRNMQRTPLKDLSYVFSTKRNDGCYYWQTLRTRMVVDSDALYLRNTNATCE